MELNRSQQLVHDNAAMEKFRRDHNIPNDVAIERSGPREEANTIEGNENHILVRIWLIHQAGLIFPISPLLNEVMARCRLTFMQMSVNFVRTMLTVDMLMQKEGMPFDASDLLHVYCIVRPR